MGLFGDDKAKQANARLTEESLYAEALREIESGLRRDGIWARALAESSMDQARAAARYIELRVQALKDERILSAKRLELQNSLEAQLELERQRKEIEAAEADLPRHPSCGGIIDRADVGRQVKWKCRKCKAVGSFRLGSA